MTDKEIIKALECCYRSVFCEYCDKCAYFNSGTGSCKLKLLKDAFALINRQQATIERLTVNMNAFGLGMKTEKERADTIRAEAIKEFAERYRTLLETELHWCECADEIIKPLDNLVKEMVGEENDNR